MDFTLGRSMNANDKPETPRLGQIWPWVAIGLLCVLTAAPIGIAKALGIDEEFNDYPLVFIVGFGVLFLALMAISCFFSGKRIGAILLSTMFLLFLLNLSGCISIWNELSGIH